MWLWRLGCVGGGKLRRAEELGGWLRWWVVVVVVVVWSVRQGRVDDTVEALVGIRMKAAAAEHRRPTHGRDYQTKLIEEND